MVGAWVGWVESGLIVGVAVAEAVCASSPPKMAHQRPATTTTTSTGTATHIHLGHRSCVESGDIRKASFRCILSSSVQGIIAAQRTGVNAPAGGRRTAIPNMAPEVCGPPASASGIARTDSQVSPRIQDMLDVCLHEHLYLQRSGRILQSCESVPLLFPEAHAAFGGRGPRAPPLTRAPLPRYDGCLAHTLPWVPSRWSEWIGMRPIMPPSRFAPHRALALTPALAAPFLLRRCTRSLLRPCGGRLVFSPDGGTSHGGCTDNGR